MYLRSQKNFNNIIKKMVVVYTVIVSKHQGNPENKRDDL
jgi:hypothetical protein